MGIYNNRFFKKIYLYYLERKKSINYVVYDYPIENISKEIKVEEKDMDKEKESEDRSKDILEGYVDLLKLIIDILVLLFFTILTNISSKTKLYDIIACIIVVFFSVTYIIVSCVYISKYKFHNSMPCDGKIKFPIIWMFLLVSYVAIFIFLIIEASSNDTFFKEYFNRYFVFFAIIGPLIVSIVICLRPKWFIKK